MTFIKKIEELLKEYDDKELVSIIDSIPARRASRRSTIEKQVRGKFDYPEVWASCGGKGWYKLLDWCDTDLVDILTKNHLKKVSDRNTKISKKFSDAGIKEVIEGKETKTINGFEGSWIFKTDGGEKKVNIEIILAGGYIQCLHNRVLVKIK